MNLNIDKKLFEEEYNKEKTRLLKDPAFNNYLKNKSINADDLNSNLYLFKDIYDSLNLCRSCKGLHMCTQVKAGYVKDVTKIKNSLVESRITCKYLNEKKNNEAFLNNFKLNEIESQHQFLSFKEIDPTDETDLYKLLYIKLFKNKDSKTGIYLFGSVGVGKSYLLSSYFNDLAREGHKVCYIRVADFMSNMGVYYSLKDKSEFYRAIDRAKEAEYLCLDDIGAEMINEFNRDQILFPILDYRMSHELPTYFVSNVSINALKSRYENTFNKDSVKAERLVERIKKLATMYELDGEDKRFKEK